MEMADTDASQANCTPKKCSEHFGECPNPMIPEGHDILHSFSAELQRMVIARVIIPEQQCIQHVFGHCFMPWACTAGTHTMQDSSMAPVTPSTCYTSRCQLVYDEGHKLFFQNNLFIFKTRHSLYRDPPSQDPDELREWFRSIAFASREDRDPRATRLLDFVDTPLFRGKGSLDFQTDVDDNSYDSVDKYRYTLRHLVLMVDSDELDNKSLALRYTWNWGLNVDFKTLPHLKTLVLDLKGYSYRQLQDPELPEELYTEQLEAGAKRMECLKLNSLIIYGLCSGPRYFGEKQHRRKMEKLFEPALGKYGKLQLRDEEHFVEW